MQVVLFGIGLLISLFVRADAICEQRFGGSYRNIYIYENGTFRITVEPIDATTITGKFKYNTIHAVIFCIEFQQLKSKTAHLATTSR